MLPYQHCIKKEKDFKKIFRKGKSFFAEFLGLKVFRNNLSVSRVGIIVGNKISKKATERNRLKRQLREILRFRINPEVAPESLKVTGKIKSGYDIVVITRPGILEQNFIDLAERVDQLLRRARLFE